MKTRPMAEELLHADT